MALASRSTGQTRQNGAVLRAIALFGHRDPVAAEGLRIVPLVRDDHVLVTFELADGFTEEVRAAVSSGLKTTFTYTVDLRLEVPVWVDRTIADIHRHQQRRVRQPHPVCIPSCAWSTARSRARRCSRAKAPSAS